MKHITEQIISHLKPLVGLQLSYARRAADMRMFGFGQIHPRKKGSAAEFTLHVQCPWRIESTEGVVTGRSDLWEPSEIIDGEDYESWDYESGNLQDVLLRELLESYDHPREYINKTQILFVEQIQADQFGGFEMNLSGGYRLVVFPSGSRGEDWRFLPSRMDEAHFVISGGRIEE